MKRFFLYNILAIFLSLPISFCDEFEISVIDTAIDFDHPMLNVHQSKLGIYDPFLGQRFDRNWDHSNEFLDDWYHGTHVAGIISSHFETDLLHTPKINSIFYIRGDESGDPMDSNESLENQSKIIFKNLETFLNDVRPKVVNLSIGENFQEYLLSISIAVMMEESFNHKYFSNRRVNRKIKKEFNRLMDIEKKDWLKIFEKYPKTLFVIAAGNDSRKLERRKKVNWFIPFDVQKYTERLFASPFLLKGYKSFIADINLKNTITVGSWNGVKSNPKASSFSNYGGGFVDIMAKGENVLSTVPGGEFEELSGTSMAAPQISGIAANILQSDLDLSPIEIKRKIYDRASYSKNLLGKSRFGRFIP